MSAYSQLLLLSFQAPTSPSRPATNFLYISSLTTFYHLHENFPFYSTPPYVKNSLRQILLRPSLLVTRKPRSYPKTVPPPDPQKTTPLDHISSFSKTSPSPFKLHFTYDPSLSCHRNKISTHISRVAGSILNHHPSIHPSIQPSSRWTR